MLTSPVIRIDNEIKLCPTLSEQQGKLVHEAGLIPPADWWLQQSKSGVEMIVRDGKREEDLQSNLTM
jgi:hypothetical protein